MELVASESLRQQYFVFNVLSPYVWRVISCPDKHSLIKIIIYPCLLSRVSGYRSRGPGSIPGATRFSEK
jgi:hypothetical protein